MFPAAAAGDARAREIEPGEEERRTFQVYKEKMTKKKKPHPKPKKKKHPSAQRLVWAAKQPLGKAALGALFA